VVTERISSPSNPRIKAFAGLKKARNRSATGLFLIEGEREVERAIAAGVALDTLLVCDDLVTRPLPDVADSVAVLQLTRQPMTKVSVRQNPAGVIAVARRFDSRLSDLSLGPRPLVLVAEAVEKPGNLGAMMRTAEAVGADAIVIADSTTDVFNPNVVRASQGALFMVPLAVASSREVVDWVEQNSLRLFGGYPEAVTEMWDVDMTGPTAIVVGAEDVGLSSVWDEIAAPVRIAMAGAADSLNASVSAALMLYEAVRQRRLE
jgi:TrmH family RNA methyltransferase